MERIKGIVLEIENRRAVILTPDGDFRDVPVYRPDWAVGQEVEVPVREPIVLYNRPQHNTSRLAFTFLGRRRQLRWPAVAVAAAIVLAVLMASAPSFIISPAPVYAAVSVDLHDSFRLYVDKDQNVVGASASSVDGMRFLAEIDYRGKPLDDVIDELVKEAVTTGGLEPDKTDQVVLMSASVLEDEKTDEHSDGVARLKERLHEATVKGKAKLRARDVDAEVAVVGIAKPDLQDRAGELGLTVNEYLILLKARDMGLDLSIKDMRGKSYVPKLRKQGVSLQEVLAQIQQEDDMTQLSAKYHDQLMDEGNNGKGHKQSEGDDLISIPPEQLGSEAESQDSVTPGKSSDVTASSASAGDDSEPADLSEPDLQNDTAGDFTSPVGSDDTGPGGTDPADIGAGKPGKHGKKDRPEEKVGRWLKKLPPPGLLKHKAKGM